MQPPHGRAVVNKRSPQHRNLRVLISPYLSPGVLGLFAEPLANIYMDISSAGVTYVYEPGFGLVWRFDGVDGAIRSQYWESVNVGTWPVGGGISVSWWQIKDSSGEVDGGRIIQHDSEVLIANVDVGGSALGFEDRRFDITAGNWEAAGQMPSSGVPTHFCVTYDAIISGSGPQLYVDGLLWGSMTETVAPSGNPTVRGNGWRCLGNNNLTGARAWDGCIWDFRAYAGVLEAAQAWQLYDPETRFDLYKTAKHSQWLSAPLAGDFPFSYDFAGTNFDPWDAAEWAVTSG